MEGCGVAAAIGHRGRQHGAGYGLGRRRCDALAIDTAHGHTRGGVVVVSKRVKESFPMWTWWWATSRRRGCPGLVEAGADAVKVGIGPGSICTTRVMRGWGPQLTAVHDCSLAPSPIPGCR